ncbi:hypothetical protein QBC38DRAFT_519237 [Podospora fimiseda]|uniref:Nephrocystin 3-like N-terminal domain-containing protein n=1 Tax=Podospora fimiseda TaxID=252190 RepID=A0AAN7BFR7_9PEZI|nr:hypothetical protein QBC38DRAFT_519237 [Podospora fimiseda]
MKTKEDAIKPVGLTVLYEPDGGTEPAVDIILVHGIGGHPVRSWKCFDEGQSPVSPITATSLRGNRLRKAPPPISGLRRTHSEPVLVKDPSLRSRNLLRKASFKSSSRLKLPDSDQGDAVDKVDVYWPLDFLPASCPTARILTWGYHTLVVDKKPLRLQGDIFAHAHELLLELASMRATLGEKARPVVFVAHSTGGVVVKEVLRLSEAERDGPLKEILLATSAVIFLGSPHRATEQSSLGDAVKSMASTTLPIDPEDPVSQQLCGGNSIELELGRQTFVRLWNYYNFKVKTFQEAILPIYPRAEERAEITMRHIASFFGDPRENAEIIGALHENMCRFGSMEDPGYQSLACAIIGCVRNEEERRHVLTSKERDCLSALLLPRVTTAVETHPPTTYPGTCLWLYDLYDFQIWHHRTAAAKNKILWINGKSGCGKTVLLRSLRTRFERQWGPAGASMIWCTPGDGSSPADLYRSLLAQIFHHDPRLRKALLALYNHPKNDPQRFDDALVVSFFADYYVNKKVETPARRTFIFVELPDDSDPDLVKEIIGRLSTLAQNSEFSICVTTNDYPEIEQEASGAISIPMHLRNTDDILRYVNLHLVAEWEERNETVITIGRKSGGVFLWAEIVVNILNAAIAEGAIQEMIDYTLEEVPGDLHGLYEWMLSTLNDRERAESLTLFQWVMLAAEQMRLNDLFVGVRLTDSTSAFASYHKFGPSMVFKIGKPFSMVDIRQLRNSEITSDTPDQFHRWLRARSIGLLELKADSGQPVGLQRVQEIHHSVRTFFLSGRGFACLSAGNSSIPPRLTTGEFMDISHYTILRACLMYLNMRDFDSLGSPKSPKSPRSPAGLNWDIPSSSAASRQQRQLITSSYPFLQYAVENLLFHMLSPTQFKYFLPQTEVLQMFSSNNYRLWKRWTLLMGTGDAEIILEKYTEMGNATAPLLSPVFGARFRLERVLKKLAKLSTSEGTLSPVGSVVGGKRRRKTKRERGILSPVVLDMGKEVNWGGGGLLSPIELPRMATERRETFLRTKVEVGIGERGYAAKLDRQPEVNGSVLVSPANIQPQREREYGGTLDFGVGVGIAV